MGLFMTLEDASAEEAALLREGVLPEAAPGEAAEGRLRVFDLHCDTLDRLAFHGDPSVPGGFAAHDARIPAARMSSLADNDAHVSLERTAGYAWCQCFAAFVPDEARGDAAWALFERVRRVWERELERCGDKLARARSMADVDAALAAGKTAGLFTVEGASFLEDDAAAEGRLDALAEAGVRMVTLTWNGRNALGSGNETADGLTGFGRSCVRELELRGIAVDVSHLNDAGFKDVCATATRPFAASHSNARAVCGHPRNLADWQLRELADAGDADARRVLEKSADYLGRALAVLIDILNPERIVIGSIYARAERHFKDGALSAIRREALSLSSGVCEIVPAGLGDSIGDIAALSIAWNGLNGAR